MLSIVSPLVLDMAVHVVLGTGFERWQSNAAYQKLTVSTTQDRVYIVATGYE